MAFEARYSWGRKGVRSSSAKAPSRLSPSNCSNRKGKVVRRENAREMKGARRSELPCGMRARAMMQARAARTAIHG
jgi:hypothetical protein